MTLPSAQKRIHPAYTDPAALKTYYLDVFRRNRAAILEASALGFDPPIRGCPGWDACALTAHMVRVYTFWGKWVRERPRGFRQEAFQELLAEREANLPAYGAWADAGFPKGSRPNGIIDAARGTGDELDVLLEALGPDETVWTFIPSQQTGAFVLRRLAMETAIHRWDIEDAHGVANPIDHDLARDGIDEMLMQYRDDPGDAYGEARKLRAGQTFLFREHEGHGRWLVKFPDGDLTVSSSDGPADVTITANSSDLLLFIMGRRSTEDIGFVGDQQLAASWGDIAGKF